VRDTGWSQESENANEAVVINFSVTYAAGCGFGQIKLS